MSIQKKYYPQLDAIRGISFLAVFIFHSLKPFYGISIIEKFLHFLFGNLIMSIDVFFVLSSFLLTFLGIKEYQKNGNFSFKNYFIRRVLRIWPLYYVLMFFSFVILKLIKDYYGVNLSLPPASWYLFFVSNYYTPDHVFFLRILWTLSVEEQFYLVWGICLMYFQKHLPLVILLFTIVSVLFNFWGALTNAAIYLNTISYLFDMMVGAFAAYSLVKKGNLINFIAKIIKIRSIIFYSFLPLLFIAYFFINNLLGGGLNKLLEEVVREIFVIYCGFVILHQMVSEKSFFNLSSNKFLVYTGKISFGLYCLHGIVITVGTIFFNKINLKIPNVFQVLILLGVTFLFATLSYYILEKPFLKLKDKLRRI